MKTNIKSTSAMRRARLFINRILTYAILALIAPLAAMAQQTVFYDTFGTSSLNQTNIAGGIPGGTPTASQTSYTILSAKVAPNTTIGSGHLQLVQVPTSSGNLECQAIFTKYPVTLASVGDYIEMTYTFNDRVPIMQSTSGTSDALFPGLFNSGGVPPQSGADLQTGGLYSSATGSAIGGTKNWVGYSSQMYNGSSGWRLYARPMQTAANNMNQGLLYNYPLAQGNGGLINPGSPNLTPGVQYTVQLRVTLSAASQLTVSNALYTGADTTGAQFTNTSWVVTGANVLTTNFDSLAIGFRATDGTGNSGWTNDITSIQVVAGLAAQAGPYFFVGSSGNPCSGGVDITLSGSVTTNVYLLYTNGIYSGQSLAGIGSALDFGAQTIPANYTVIASNTVTASMGPMYGSASVYAPGVAINAQPSSVTIVTNLPTSFTVTATGAGLNYQWYKNGVALTNSSNISGVQTTNLNIAAVGINDAGTGVGGYTVVVNDPCGNFATSAPPVSLTLAAPRNLIWAGNNPYSAWDYTTDQEFTLGGSPASFQLGDNATFDDSSSFQSVTVSNNVTPTLIKVVGTKSYTFSGPITAQITGVSQMLDGSLGTLTILNNNNFTGGTIVSNGATLSIGNGSGITGSLQGTVTVSNTGTLNYSSSASSVTTVINILNSFGGSGTINVNDAAGATYATGLSLISSNFNGTINIQGFTRLHASDGNAGYAFGNGSTVNAPDNTQAWLDRSATAYNNTFNIGGTGWQGATPQTGAMSIFGNIVNGPINLLDNARIGGTINGGTIQSVISGPYQLEVWGNTNSYVLIMGPTNGLPQAYASTLITAGSIQAANSNAISRGPLTLDSGGDLRLFGNNLTVSNLSSINSGQILLVEGPRVRNMNTTNSATLTVGTDGTSTEFDGTFSDGAAASFGLTKVGAGTLTLTAVNTNTGAVTVNGGTLAMSGSGSFGKASQIIASGGGFYDVTGAGGTLTLNSGQTLRGNNGTVNGILVASAGSTVAPGFPMGTLTVSGNATVSGTYRANLNRTNSPGNCSKLTSSGGSISYSGATLSVTNVGPILQAGDSFQLFSGATAGFTAAALQTNDVPNNAKYTWNNNVSTTGSITVASVSQIVNTTSTNIVTSVTNGLLTLNWPADHTGWTLQSQTNSLSVGLGTNWVNIPSSTTTNQLVIPINTTNGSVFFRMKY